MHRAVSVFDGYQHDLVNVNVVSVQIFTAMFSIGAFGDKVITNKQASVMPSFFNNSGALS